MKGDEGDKKDERKLLASPYHLYPVNLSTHSGSPVCLPQSPLIPLISRLFFSLCLCVSVVILFP
jgi:hypothetical protein